MENRNIRIAIADDHKLVRAGLIQILDAVDNFQVVLDVSNGQELLDNLKESRPDLVLLDIEMPIMDGKKTLTNLQETHPHVKVIMLTIHQHNSFIVHLMEKGASGYLLKDTSPNEVITAIQTVMDEGIYFNSRVSNALLQGLSGTAVNKSNLPSDSLNQRDMDVLRLICEENTTVQIAEKLFLSPKTIEGYRKALLEKTGTKNVAGLAIYAVKNGLI